MTGILPIEGKFPPAGFYPSIENFLMAETCVPIGFYSLRGGYCYRTNQ